MLNVECACFGQMLTQLFTSAGLTKKIECGYEAFIIFIIFYKLRFDFFPQYMKLFSLRQIYEITSMLKL